MLDLEVSSGKEPTEQHALAVRRQLSIELTERGWSIEDLARASGISRRTITAIDRGKSRGSIESWLKMCDAFEIAFATFVKSAVVAHISRGEPEKTTLRLVPVFDAAADEG